MKTEIFWRAFSYVLGFIIGVFTTAQMIETNGIKSPKPITPEIQVTIRGEKSDTVYVYKR